MARLKLVDPTTVALPRRYFGVDTVPGVATAFYPLFLARAKAGVVVVGCRSGGDRDMILVCF